ncbi:DUF808 domain-containing protein [Pseudotamlana carrageenivorans]|uniref:DUF808 domain-containing protein n=1 Tax=Pseudotamlana carrageenivorans TaxID=2069432 RepID=A0A2I7SDY5_9FLAO|nr:DUF808 domain-containing protein [Tamlana carrageenivorans]AUS04103.1 DUF808 domain-containing protein [Tamlana carrageenivorans]
MASGFFALLDDIASLMDDVVVMSKVSAKKTAGILGDDLAVNAEKATGFLASRELPVLWDIAKGSLLNKVIILPIAFLLSAFAPWGVTLALILGGVYLAFEGVEKIIHYIFPDKEDQHPEVHVEKQKLTAAERVEAEKKKIKAAIVTDFILSVEIVIISLGSVVGEPLLTQILVVSVVALIATIGVYGIVALIVRMDDFGFKLINLNSNKKSLTYVIGGVLVKTLPWVIKILAVVGTIALLLVSGGIFVHHIDYFHHFLEDFPFVVREFILGLLIGGLAFLIFKGVVGIKKLVTNR